jgi:pyruvate dehydrogenase E1 component alpha subunit
MDRRPLSLGVVYALKSSDWLVPSFRENAAMLWRGWPMVSTFHFWGGYELGAIPPKGVNDLPICVPVASQCLHGMGVAWGLKLRQENAVCITFVGDGGTSEGDFHEALNFAGVFQLPLVMVVQNNQWAISMPREKQTNSETIAQKAVAYGMDAIQVDGNDLLGTIVAGQEAIERARSGGGPTLIEALTYRLAQHTSADDPRRYRDEAEVNKWESRDPLPRFANYLRDAGILDDRLEKLFDEEIERELDQAAKAYAATRIDPMGFFDHMLSELTPDLRAQRAELEALRAEKISPSDANAGYSHSRVL